MSATKTRSQIVTTNDVVASLWSRCPVLWIKTSEEARVEQNLVEGCKVAKYMPHFWDVAAGLTGLDGKPERDRPEFDPPEGPDVAMDVIRKKSEQVLPEEEFDRNLWIMRDLPVWLEGAGGALTLRQLRNLARSLPGTPRNVAQAIVVLSPKGDVPPELSNHVTVINWPLPDRTEIGSLLDDAIDSLPDNKQTAAVNGSRDAAIDAAVGLSGEEAQATFARSLATLGRIDPATIAAEKKRAIERDGLMEWVDPLPGGLDAVGGLENLKTWLVARSLAFSPAARAYGLPAPKGTLVVGVSGCGKSLTAKAIATEWRVPLIRLDLGALKSKYVGESEQNLRKALSQIEAIGRCVVWLDEIEKALAGASGDSGDGGVSADALGAILSWMQDRPGEAFVIATANNAERLPPELLRKGRFDEVWWVDLPTRGERAGIMNAALHANGRDAAVIGVDLEEIAAATNSFTGAEIAALVPDALFAAFADKGREINTVDLMIAAKNVVPLAKTASEKIGKLREFWLGRARAATKADVVDVKSKSKPNARQLDLQ